MAKIVHVILLFVTYTCCGQVGGKFIKSDSLKFRSVQLSYNNKFKRYLFSSEQGSANYRGTGFFIKFKGEIYFVSNYHLFSSRMIEDTTFFTKHLPVSEPYSITVSMYSNNKQGYIETDLETRDSEGNRLWLSKPVDIESRAVSLDIGVLPINDLPDSAMIYPIQIEKDTDFFIDRNTQLYCVGFSKRTWYDISPYIDTLHSVGDTTFTQESDYITVYNPGEMHGSSGSPVFMSYKRRKIFIGVYFSTVPVEYQPLDIMRLISRKTITKTPSELSSPQAI
jgi:hypothetical protein